MRIEEEQIDKATAFFLREIGFYNHYFNVGTTTQSAAERFLREKFKLHIYTTPSGTYILPWEVTIKYFGETPMYSKYPKVLSIPTLFSTHEDAVEAAILKCIETIKAEGWHT